MSRLKEVLSLIASLEEENAYLRERLEEALEELEAERDKGFTVDCYFCLNEVHFSEARHGYDSWMWECPGCAKELDRIEREGTAHGARKASRR